MMYCTNFLCKSFNSVMKKLFYNEIIFTHRNGLHSISHFVQAAKLTPLTTTVLLLYIWNKTHAD